MSDLQSEEAGLIDRSVKLLFRSQPQALLRLAGVPAADSVRFEDANLNLPELRADHVLVVEPHAPQEAYALYVEYQLKPEPHKLPQWGLKWNGLCRQLPMPVVLLVIYLEKGDRATFPAQHRTSGGGLQTNFSFDTVHLWEYRDRIASGEWAELAPLLVLCEAGPTEETVRQERALILGSGLSQEVQTELMGVALLVASRRFSHGVLAARFAEELVQMDTLEELKELFYEAGSFRHWLQDPRIGGELRELAKEEGRQEGKEEGRVAGQESIVLRQLQRKFGAVSPALQERVHGLSAAPFEELAEALLDFTSIDDVDAWIVAHSSAQ